MFTQALASNSSDFRRIKSLVFSYNRVYLYGLANREKENAYHYSFVSFRISVFLSFKTRPQRAVLVE